MTAKLIAATTGHHLWAERYTVIIDAGMLIIIQMRKKLLKK